jgi:hypothetical protein
VSGAVGYGVDPDALKEAADGVNGAISELKSVGSVSDAVMGEGFAGLSLSGMETGSADLTSSFAAFCDRWEWGVRALVQDGSQFAERLGLAAGTYNEMEDYAKDTLKVVYNADLGNPDLTEDQVEGMSAKQVAADNPFTQLTNSDTSQKSFQDAFSAMGTTWKDTGRDITDGTVPGMPVSQKTLADLTGNGAAFEAAQDQVFGPSPQERAQQQGEGGN